MMRALQGGAIEIELMGELTLRGCRRYGERRVVVDNPEEGREELARLKQLGAIVHIRQWDIEILVPSHKVLGAMVQHYGVKDIVDTAQAA